MTVIFRGGRGHMRYAGDFSSEIIDVSNENALLILEELGFNPQSKEGLTGSVPIRDFIKKCSAWIAEVESNPSLDVIYLLKKISKLMVDAIVLTGREEPFTHICWG